MDIEQRMVPGWVTVTGAAALDLLLELRDHAAARAQHVAEAHGDEARTRVLGHHLRHHHLGRAPGGDWAPSGG
jgi:hypothetical protein